MLQLGAALLREKSALHSSMNGAENSLYHDSAERANSHSNTLLTVFVMTFPRCIFASSGCAESRAKPQWATQHSTLYSSPLIAGCHGAYHKA